MRNLYKIHNMSRCRKTSMKGVTVPLLLYSLFSILIISSAVDTISKTQIVSDGQTIVSSDETFEMGFFSPGDSKNRYVGICYKKLSPGLVVWVANREIPLNDTLGVLQVIDPGILILLNGRNNTIWSTNTSRTVQYPVVQLLDSGNLVVRDANDNNPDNFLWQGFDYPCDTQLPGMKLGKSLVTGQERSLSSWKSKDDPAKGDYASWLDLRGYPQLFIIRQGYVDRFRLGPWNGVQFSGTPNLIPNPIYHYGMYFGRQEVSYRDDLYNSSIVSRFTLNSNGHAQRWVWVDRTGGWVLYLALPTDNCDDYKLCGPYGSCDVSKSPVCSCLDKFVPRNPKDWERTNWSGGCVRRTQLRCHNGDGFVKYSNIKLPCTWNSWYDVTMTLSECMVVCLKNCSCMAYTILDIRGGIGCLLWFDELVDMREFSENGQDIYIRMASSDSDSPVQHGGSNDKKKVIFIAALSVIAIMFLLGLYILLYVQKRKNDEQLRTKESHKEDLELPLFDFDTIASCTNNFSDDNKLGRGGFGPVHKGRLEDGREIAVKRLSKTSRQGLDEFKNEVICIAKLQHRNLVKLLGCCIQGEERMLVYEFMPNKSLDSFIFDESRRTLLDWPKRYHIINGIARGLLYLHQDSRLRIIHRDLKASNILLDIEMNPKISDFGMARIFVGNETEINTERVVGTYGYMSPEYAVDGLFSVKSDVFSFGVLMLETVSGKRNKGFFHPDHYLNLLGHFCKAKVGTTNRIAKIWQEVYLISEASVLAWTLHKEDRSIELIDPTARESCCPEVLRSIHVGLLCVQQHPEDRPSMLSVVLMLGSESSLPWPKQPGFFTDRNLYKADTSSSKDAPSSTSTTNGLTITALEPR